MGLSFAIPIDVALEISTQLKSSGKITRGWLGIAIQEISKELAESFSMKNTNGALVAGVEKNGPADKGGLEPGDVITKFDEKSIIASADLPRAVASAKLGKIVSVEILRKGSVKVLNVGVGEMSADPNEAPQSSKPAVKPEMNRIGLTLKELTVQQRKKLNNKNGLLVVDSQGAVAQAGVRHGDVILGLNNSEIQSLEQFNKQLAGVPVGKTIALLVQRGENTLYVPVKIPAGK